MHKKWRIFSLVVDSPKWQLTLAKSKRAKVHRLIGHIWQLKQDTNHFFWCCFPLQKRVDLVMMTFLLTNGSSVKKILPIQKNSSLSDVCLSGFHLCFSHLPCVQHVISKQLKVFLEKSVVATWEERWTEFIFVRYCHELENMAIEVNIWTGSHILCLQF